MSKLVHVTMLAAIGVAGEIAQPDDVVLVTETEAMNFKGRKKARDATPEEIEEFQLAALVAEEDDAEPEPKPEPPKTGAPSKDPTA